EHPGSALGKDFDVHFIARHPEAVQGGPDGFLGGAAVDLDALVAHFPFLFRPGEDAPLRRAEGGCGCRGSAEVGPAPLDVGPAAARDPRIGNRLQPVANPCWTMLKRLDTTQYRVSPAATWNEKIRNMKGMNSIMRFICCCCGSEVVMVDIFCTIHCVTAVATGRMTRGQVSGLFGSGVDGRARLWIQRKDV